MSLDLLNLSKVFGGNGHSREVEVVSGFNYRIENGNFVSLVGPSGCGKTTLLRIVAGLEKATSGRVLLDGRDIAGRDAQVGLVFQEYALFPWRTALENIEVGLEVMGRPRDERRRMALELVRQFGLSGFEHNFPRELSGGMCQRVAIARTLIMNPRVILMDEPFGSLDSQTRDSMQEFLIDVWQKWHTTIVFVTHNVDEAVFLSDEILVLSARPTRIINRFKDFSPRPRDRTSQASNEVRRKILNLLKNDRKPV